jgi:sulfotransferase family protein
VALRVVGAGLGRTGTNSLKLALEQLLGGPCYHMLEVIAHPDHAAEWERAAEGDPPDWARLLDGYVATVDWPAAAFYEELMAVYPDAIVLLSTRQDAEAWWRSADATIFQAIGRVRDDPGPVERMIFSMLDRQFTPEWGQHDASVAAYLRHNEQVRARVPASRLVEWTTGDGWRPLCRALGVPEPDAPFPHVNTTSDFRAMTGLDRS